MVTVGGGETLRHRATPVSRQRSETIYALRKGRCRRASQWLVGMGIVAVEHWRWTSHGQLRSIMSEESPLRSL